MAGYMRNEKPNDTCAKVLEVYVGSASEKIRENVTGKYYRGELQPHPLDVGGLN